MPRAESAPDGQALITVTRHNFVKDLLRSYSVFVDRTPVGTLWAFQSGRYVVAPGHHEVCLRVGRRTVAVSPQVELDADAGDVRNFRTGSMRLGLSWRSLLSRTPQWEGGPWITLKPGPAPSGPRHAARAHRPAGGSTPVGGSAPVSAPSPVSALTPAPPAAAEAPFRKALRGYRASEVDDFLADVDARAGRGEDVTGVIADVTFHAARRGYDIEEVDAHLAHMAKTLGR